MVFNSNYPRLGSLRYIYNETPSDVNSWSVSQPINNMYYENEEFKNKYALARKQIKSNLGVAYPKTAPELRLFAGDSKTIGNKQLIFQKDGNLVVYDNSVTPRSVFWNSNTRVPQLAGAAVCSSTCFATFTVDGKVVIYNNSSVVHTVQMTQSLKDLIRQTSINLVKSDDNVLVSNFLTSEFRGAYPWISWEGADLFYQSVYSRFNNDGAIRAAWSAVGESTGWQVRHIDGAFRESVNPDGLVDKKVKRKVLFTSAIAGSSSIWNPFREKEYPVFPVHNKRPVMLFYASNFNEVAEVSFQDYFDGGYLTSLSMNKALSLIDLSSPTFSYATRTSDRSGVYVYKDCDGAIISEAQYSEKENINCVQDQQYDATKTPDISGNNIFGTLKGGVSFSEENYGDITKEEYLGTYVKFQTSGSIAGSFNPAQFNKEFFSVEFALKPLSGFSGLANARILTIPGILNVNLTKTRAIEVTLYNASSSPISTIQNISTAIIDSNTWSHIGLSWDSRTKELFLYKNGTKVGDFKIVASFRFSNSNGTFQIGPQGLSTAGSSEIYALDEFKISKVVRTRDDFLDSAFILKKNRDNSARTLSTASHIVSSVENMRLSEINLMVNKAKLGSLLFKDNRLSVNNKISCMSCHNPDHGFADKAEKSQGVSANQTSLNTPHLMNRAFGRYQNWEGKHGSVVNQLLDPISHPDEMGLAFNQIATKISAVTDYVTKFRAIYGPSTTITEKQVQEVLGVFVNSIVTGKAVYTSTHSDTATKGKELFFGKARCVACHNGDLFSDEQFHKTGLVFASDATDVRGRIKVSGRSDDKDKFRTPSLINISKTGPYFHDGSVDTLEAVIDLYNNAGSGSDYDIVSGGADINISSELKPLGLDPEEKSYLLDYLNSLDAPIQYLVPNELSSLLPREQVYKINPTTSFTFSPGQVLESAYAKFVFQTDGNLVIYDLNGRPLWESTKIPGCSSGTNNCYVRFQSDGNLVIYNNNDVAVWQSGTKGSNLKLEISNEYPFLKISNPAGLTAPDIKESDSVTRFTNYSEGQFRVKNKGGAISTSVNSCTISPALPVGLTFNNINCEISGTVKSTIARSVNYIIKASNDVGFSLKTVRFDYVNPTTLSYSKDGLTLAPGDIRQSSAVQLRFQKDGNLAIYDLNNTPLWASGVTFSDCTVDNNCYAKFQGDGNVVVYLGATPKWSSRTVSSKNLVLEASNVAPFFKIYDEDSGLLAPKVAIVNSRINITNRSNVNVTFNHTGGGAIKTCTISPALPTGMLFNATTCAITGKNTLTSNSSVAYTVTTSNDVGYSSTRVTLNYVNP